MERSTTNRGPSPPPMRTYTPEPSGRERPARLHRGAALAAGGATLAAICVALLMIGSGAVAPSLIASKSAPGVHTDSSASDATDLEANLPTAPTASSDTSPPLVAAGPMTSLAETEEVGPSLGAVPQSQLSVPLGQKQLVVVSLPFRNAPTLSAFLAAVSDPSSPLYDQFLSNEQFTAEYGPAPVDQQGIANYLESHGLSIVYLSSDHATVAATGTLGELAATFGVTFHVYSKAGQVFFAPSQSPSVPASLAPWVQQVTGLTNYNFGYAPQLVLDPHATRSADAAEAGTGVLDYPMEMTEEYQLTKLWNATGNASAGTIPSYAQGVVIATALWDLNASAYCPYSLTDIEQFFHDGGQSTYEAPNGMPTELPAPLDHANYNVTGDTTVAPGTGNCTSPTGTGPNAATEELDFEMTIDQEYSGEDAPGALIEPTYVGGVGVTVEDSDLTLLLSWIAAGNIPNLSVLSQSFGGGENGTSWESDYEELAAKGVTVLASSGDDNGAEGDDFTVETLCDTGAPGEYSWNTEGTPGVDYPGSSPNVLSVGGTANMATASSVYDYQSIQQGQTVWNWCPSTDSGESAGSTGGVSEEFTEPSFQSAVPVVNRAMDWAIKVTETGNFTAGAPPTGCEGCANGSVASPDSARAVPDLAGPAAMDAGYMAGTWVTNFGGTSFSSPSVAGMLGSIMAFDGHKLGFVDPALYQLEEAYLNGSTSGLPFPLDPTYFVQNYSNAFFNGSSDYNTSSGWGVPQAYNIALLLGKPFIATNPQGIAVVHSAYPVSATIKDDREVTSARVAYRTPGASSWANASLSLTGGTPNDGVWSGLIPAASSAGTLEYCVDAVDSGLGNSWSPYNQSAWAATGGQSLSFGCTTPFTVAVHAPAKGYSVKFAEQGLPADTDWAVELALPDGVHATEGQNSSVSQVLSFKEPNGEYAYTFLAVPGYHIHKGALSGTVTVDGANPATTTTDWTLTKFSVEFSESGLPARTHWSVTIDGLTHSGTGTQLSFNLPNGSFTFSVVASGYTETSNPPSPLTIDGAAVVVLVRFS